ncbi:FecR family protein [Variovorax sp.]|jgi:transmembrane sensor|uniref:FecR family protein n=1 Tax=Variovorax sp. TaxID=1871043 RepID=UPI0037DA6F8B
MKTSPHDGIAPPDELQRQAAAWLRQLTSGRASDTDAEAFLQWKRASPAHQAAFEEARRRWRMLKPALGELLREDPQTLAHHRQALRGAIPKPALGRRAFVGAAVGALAVAGIAVVRPPLGLWPAASTWTADFHTGTGEQQAIALADRIDVLLNTQTSVRRVEAGGRVVGMELLAGEAAIDLRAGSPAFQVAAGPGRSMAESGRFEVRYLAGRVCVSCLEGTVRVAHPAGERLLQARQQTLYDTASIGGVVGIEPAAVSAWRSGELVFSQVPLAQVIDEINRYRPGRVLLMNEAAGGDPVSGRFFVASLESALSQLQHSFQLKARRLPAGVLVLS